MFNSICCLDRLLAFCCRISIPESNYSKSFIISAYGKIGPGFISISSLFSKRYHTTTKKKERLNLDVKAYFLLLELPLNEDFRDS